MIKISSFYSLIAIVIILSSIPLIELPCPVDGGTGYLSGIGPENVRVVGVSQVDLTIVTLPCEVDVVYYKYIVKITLQNDGPPASGYIEVIVKDPTNNMIIERQPVYLEIGEKTKYVYLANINFKVPMRRLELEYLENVLEVRIPTSHEFVCPVCKGAGKVSSIEWLLGPSLIKGDHLKVEPHREPGPEPE